jgi:dTDP-4-dehydrorhamnose reductase
MVTVRDTRRLYKDKTLVLGATGLLGATIYREFKRSVQTRGTYFRSRNEIDKEMYLLDASDFSQLAKVIEASRATQIINCVGLTSVEDCERRPEASWKVNSEIPLRLAQICNSQGIKLIHISTDHYMSSQNQPRNEIEQVRPVNQYGLSKFEAEAFVQSINSDALILRTNFFGHKVGGSNSLLDFALQAMSANTTVMGFDDVHFSPVSTTEIARFLLDPRSKDLTGLLNFSSEEIVTKFEFLRMIAQIKNFDLSSIHRASILDSGLRVKRPSYLALDSTRLTKDVGYKLPSLGTMLRNELDSLI